MSNYGTVDAYKAYHAERGNVIGTHSDAKILEALLVASEWIDAKYRALFPGLKVGMREQVREWPRSGALDYYGYAISSLSVPVEIEYAVYEATLIHLTGSKSLSVDWTPAQYRKVSIDGAISLEYADFSSSQDVQTQFKKIDEILSLLVTVKGAASGGLSGASVRA